jgi:hypothetical protein
VALGAAPARAVDEPTLSATVIDGSSAYTPTQLFAAYRDQLGRPINPSSAQAILAQIEALYLRDGFTPSSGSMKRSPRPASSASKCSKRRSRALRSPAMPAPTPHASKSWRAI